GGLLSRKAEECGVLRAQLKVELRASQKIVKRLRNIVRRQHVDVQRYQELRESDDIGGHRHVVVLVDALERPKKPGPVCLNWAADRPTPLVPLIGRFAGPAMSWIGEVVDLGQGIVPVIEKPRTVELVPARFGHQTGDSA